PRARRRRRRGGCRVRLPSGGHDGAFDSRRRHETGPRPPRRRSARSPVSLAGGGRRHRDQRQDHGHALRGGHRRGRRVEPGAGGDHRRPCRGERVELGHTTPEATTFQRLLARMRDEGCRLVATEVSSHALVMGRVAATRFEVAAFTNLSQDHLDFHGDMASYLAAKQTLFTDYEVGSAVVNIDDPAGAGIAARTVVPTVRVGQGGEAYAEDVTPGPSGASFRIVTPWGS